MKPSQNEKPDGTNAKRHGIGTWNKQIINAATWNKKETKKEVAAGCGTGFEKDADRRMEKIAQRREEWKKVVKEAKAHKGL